MHNHNKALILVFELFFIIIFVECLPFMKPDLENRTELRDEVHYPNGSIIGKYTYVDDEGNPINVKYFADEGSYGVELKSVKTLVLPNQNLITENKLNDTTESVLSPLSLSDPFLDSNFDKIQTKNKDAKDSKANIVNNRENNYKTNTNYDYDVYVKNDLEPPKNSKEKVRVYIDKLSRKSRGLGHVYKEHEENYVYNAPLVCHK